MNAKRLTELESQAMYSGTNIDTDVIIEEYFRGAYSLNEWFLDASYGQVGFKGTVVGTMRVDKEYTADEMYEDKDHLLSLASEQDGVNMKDIDVFVIYGRCKSGSKHHALTMDYTVQVGLEQYENVGL